jgi:hypothetical protein
MPAVRVAAQRGGSPRHRRHQAGGSLPPIAPRCKKRFQKGDWTSKITGPVPFLKSFLYGMICGDGIQSRADLFQARPRYLLHDFAIAQEHEVRPKLDLKRSSERLAFAILYLDVPHRRVVLQQGRQLRLEGPAIRSPLRAEFQENRALHLVDLLASRLPVVEG